MKLSSIISAFPPEKSFMTRPRPYINHSVEFKKSYSALDRVQALEKAGLNVFFFPSEMITGGDFLSDSGTTTMTSEQWAALHMGDEAYGSNRGYFLLRESILSIFGEQFFNLPQTGRANAFLFHQGRPAEDALFSVIGKLGDKLIIPSNGHFDTTEANIEAHNIKPVNLFCRQLKENDDKFRFKGNMDIDELKKLFKKHAEKIPLVYLTITNNTGGGQPVSLINIQEVSEISKHYHVPLFFDACRFAENAWFIQKYEKDYKDRNIKEIVREMFKYADGFTISFKKDGLVNMGGGFFTKDSGLFIKKYPHIPDTLTNYQIRTEGHPSYGGMSGRDIMALAVGLKTVVRQDYLDYRIRQVVEFGNNLHKNGIPVVIPIGGHAVYLDMNKFYKGTMMKPEDFGGISFTAMLLSLYGHRACELGYYAFGKYNPETKKDTFPEINFVRFAVPRLRYEREDLDCAIEAVTALYKNRDKIPKVEVVYGRELPLRHFKSRFRFKYFY